MTDEERARDIVVALVNSMRGQGATADKVMDVAKREIAAVRAEEREACAKLVEDADVETYGGYHDNDDGQATLNGAAKAIRARGQS